MNVRSASITGTICNHFFDTGARKLLNLFVLKLWSQVYIQLPNSSCNMSAMACSTDMKAVLFISNDCKGVLEILFYFCRSTFEDLNHTYGRKI